jgi:hypothetical protein
MNRGLKNEDLLKNITIKGSNALKPKNEFGIYTSGEIGGVISEKLKKPSYDITELKRAVSTDIVELIIDDDLELDDVIPRQLFNEATQSIIALTQDIERLTTLNAELSGKVGDLELATQSLEIELDSVKIVETVLENQLQESLNRTETIIGQLQFAVQKSTTEAVERTSLFARNDALSREVNTLRGLLGQVEDQLEGRAAQLEGGALLGGSLFTFKPIPFTEQSQPRIYATQKFSVESAIKGRSFKSNKDIKFVNGNRIEIFNTSNEPIQVSIARKSESAWISLPPAIEVPSRELRTITLSTDKDWNKSKYGSSPRGEIIIRARQGGVTQEQSIGTKIERSRE